MKNVLVKNQIGKSKTGKPFVRYRLYAIDSNCLEPLSSEENLPAIAKEIIRLDCSDVRLDLDHLNEEEQNLIFSDCKKLTELNKDEKVRFSKYHRKRTKQKVQ